MRGKGGLPGSLLQGWKCYLASDLEERKGSECLKIIYLPVHLLEALHYVSEMGTPNGAAIISQDHYLTWQESVRK